MRHLYLIIFCVMMPVLSYAQYEDFKIVQNTPINYTDSITRTEDGEKMTKKIINKHEIFQYLSAYPVEEVWERARWYDNYHIYPYLQTSTGMILHGLYYRVCKDGDTLVINSKEVLKEHFTPITDEMMALAYVYVLDEYKPMHDFSFLTRSIEEYKAWLKERQTKYEVEILEIPEKTRTEEIKECEFIPLILDPLVDVYENWLPYLPQLETSYIKAVADGYEMLLYRHHLGRRGSHYSVSKLFLSKEGELKIISYETAMTVESSVHWD